VAHNDVGPAARHPDISGIVTAVNSLVESTAGTTFTPGSAGNVLGQDPLLEPLANNGGPTKTHALLAGSPALDHGANPAGLATDQRGAGFVRLSGPGVDIGALEVQLPLRGEAGGPPTAQALQAAVQLIQAAGRAGIRLAAGAVADLGGGRTQDLALAFRLKSGRLLVVTFNGADGRVLGAFLPFPARLKAGARVQLLTADLNGDGTPEIVLLVTGGGSGVPRLSAFTATGRRVL
jgi:hypothetical protein